MMKQLIAWLLALFLMSAAWSQDAEETDVAEVDSTEVAAAAEPEEEEEMDDSELDEQGYGTEEEEDDFIPSQEVSADQSLPFPVDI